MVLHFTISMNVLCRELIRYHRHIGPTATANWSYCDSELIHNLEKFSIFGGIFVYSSNT